MGHEKMSGVSTPVGATDEAGEVVPDLAARRPEVVRRLLERGVPARTLQALFPGWDVAIDEGGTGR